MENNLKQKKVCVMGCGAFGTALAYISACNGHLTYIYSRCESKVNTINSTHLNPQVATPKPLPDNLVASADIAECLQDSQFCLLALPLQMIPAFLEDNRELFLQNRVPLVSSSKGMCVQQKQFLSELVQEKFEGKIDYGVISGPSFAEEMLKDEPTLVVMASEKSLLANQVQEMMSNQFFRIYSQGDVLGVEIAGALKNVIAVGAGIVQGSGYGYNTKTALVARSTREMHKFMEIYGARGDALYGLAGIGDLMLTCFGKLSRNMTFGVKLASGMSKDQIIQESKGVVEGIPTMKVVIDYARQKNVHLPIIENIYKIVEGKIDIKKAGELLMTAELSNENDEALYNKTPSYKFSL